MGRIPIGEIGAEDQDLDMEDVSGMVRSRTLAGVIFVFGISPISFGFPTGLYDARVRYERYTRGRGRGLSPTYRTGGQVTQIGMDATFLQLYDSTRC